MPKTRQLGRPESATAPTTSLVWVRFRGHDQRLLTEEGRGLHSFRRELRAQSVLTLEPQALAWRCSAIPYRHRGLDDLGLVVPALDHRRPVPCRHIRFAAPLQKCHSWWLFSRHTSYERV